VRVPAGGRALDRARMSAAWTLAAWTLAAWTLAAWTLAAWTLAAWTLAAWTLAAFLQKNLPHHWVSFDTTHMRVTW
jgi:hypothetical protein